MSADVRPLRDRILDELKRRPGQKAADLAQALGCDRREVNRCLTFEIAGRVRQESDYRWHLTDRGDLQTATAPAPTTEIARLCRYYLECISQDMDEGASVSAKNQYGDPAYASLSSLPIGSDTGWWNAPDIGRLLGKVRAERGKLMLWLGYPARLRQHRAGFFVEPVLMWPVVVPEEPGSAPGIDEHMPTINAKFLRSIAIGDWTQVAEEAVRLADELGLGVPVAELPDVEEVVERLARIRSDWDWREALDPAALSNSPPLADVTIPGIYNRAVMIPSERSPYTHGLETELKALGDTPAERLGSTALGRWLTADVTSQSTETRDEEPLIEVLPMNTEQRMAVRAALTAQHTVVTGPPGTGKSQVVTNMLVNAAWRGLKVLFASKNNKAVDVVEARVNSLGDRPMLLRMGSKDYQASLAGHLTQLLSGNPSAVVQASYAEALGRHRSLAGRLAGLDQIQQKTLASRNLVDRLDEETDDLRQLFGTGFGRLTAGLRNRVAADLLAVSGAIDGVDRQKLSFILRALWSAFRARRHRNLTQAVQKAAPTFRELGVTWPDWKEEDGIALLRERLEQVRARLKSVSRVVEYREALHFLQGLPSFEDIARQRATLTEGVGENSTHLWRDWVELMPTRLTPAQRKDIADYAAGLQLLTGSDASRVHPSVKRRVRTLQSKVTGLFSCWAVTSLSARNRVPMEAGYFDLVVIDEASQCDIASALPLLYRAKRSVIIGDPMQLRHISALTRPRDSELQHKYGLVETRLGWMYSVSSLFDVAAGIVSPGSIVKLRDHHRSHADIIGFSNEAFYEGQLRVATRYKGLKRPNAKQPGIVWQDVGGSVTRPRDGGAQNEAEARAVTDAVANLLVAQGFAGTIGVVTPFRAQAQLLQKMLSSRPEIEPVAGPAELLVDTVHKFQGDERDVMFFSPVVSTGISHGALGFLRSNGNLFNVAITRARGLLHVVGDRAAAAACGVDYLEKFAEYVSGLDTNRESVDATRSADVSLDYSVVTHPERVSEWERILYRAMVGAGLRPIAQFSVEQYDLDFALIDGERRLAIEVDGERYHRSWTGELCLSDQLRNQRLIELGWDVRRFWVYEIRDELDRCVRGLVEWLARPGRAREQRQGSDS
jgi:very-short-patch-repair endonuclease